MTLLLLQEDGRIWEKHQMNNVKYEAVSVNAGDSYTKIIGVKKDQRLVYEFICNRDLELSVSKRGFTFKK
jgi:hypothetical protein